MNFFNEVYILFFLIIVQFKQIFVYWLAGLLAGSAASVFATEKINSLIGGTGKRKPGFLAIVPAALLGVASPLCMYGTVPLIAALGRKGVPQHLLATFMVSSILINPNLFLFSFALGTPMALARLGLCILAGIAAGLLVRFFFRGKALFNFDGFEEVKKKERSKSAMEFLRSVNRGIITTGPYFLGGIVLTALFDRYFPKELIYGMFGSNKGFGVLLAASLGVPIYVCGGGTIPLIKAWMDSGMSPGSALAFMISGPATKITNLSAVKIILGVRNFGLYIAFNIVFAVASGMIADMITGM